MENKLYNTKEQMDIEGKAKFKLYLDQMREEAKKAREEKNKKDKEKLERVLKEMIPKDQLVDGEWYFVIPEYARGQNIVQWDAKKDKFMYINYQFGFFLNHMDYLGDVADTNTAGCAPMELIKNPYEKYE